MYHLCKSKSSKQQTKTSKPPIAKQMQTSVQTTPHRSEQSDILSSIVDQCVNRINHEGTLENALQDLLSAISAEIPVWATLNNVTIVPAQAAFSIMSVGMRKHEHLITVRESLFRVHITYC